MNKNQSDFLSWIYYCFYFLIFFYCCSSTVVSISALTPCPIYPHLPPWTNPLWLCPCVLYTCSLIALPLFSPIIPLPSGYCQFVVYFNVSGYILLACLFCWLGSAYRWDHILVSPVHGCLSFLCLGMPLHETIDFLHGSSPSDEIFLKTSTWLWRQYMSYCY